MRDGDGAVRVLVVDDDSEIRSVLQLFLETAGRFELVGGVSRASDALTYSQYQRPDVVVLDLALAGVDGLEVAEALLERDRDLPIVVFSGYLHPAVLAHAERIGVRECVAKDRIGDLPEVLARHARTAELR